MKTIFNVSESDVTEMAEEEQACYLV